MTAPINAYSHLENMLQLAVVPEPGGRGEKAAYG